MPVSEQWIETEDPRVSTAADGDCQWWMVFDDPVLDQLIQTAAQQNLSVQEAGAKILEARARLAQAHGNLFPQVQEGFGSLTHTQFSRTMARPIKVPIFDNWLAGFNASWELDFWGRYRRGLEASAAEFDAADDDWQDTLVMVQSEVAAAYIQIRLAQERIRLAEKNIELQRKTLTLAESRFQQGKTTKLDETQAREILATTQSLIPQLRISLREAENALCVLLGAPPYDLESELGFASIPRPPREVAVGIPAQLLNRRPDVRYAERQVAAQSARIGVAESDLYPRIAITGMIGYESRQFSRLFENDSFTGTVGPGFRWNILNYGRIINNIRAEEAEFQQQLLNYQKVVIKAHEEVENGLNRFLQQQDRLAHLTEGLAAAEESNQLARDQYSNGKVDFQRLLDSERVLVLRQDRLADARGQVALSLVAVYKGLGGGWQTSDAPDPDPPGELEPIALPEPEVEPEAIP